ncbi:hypothetical protein [Neorhodopirellula pilleata]|uniref:Uncharacterized protein n=1 Tax=Neorhodopirellula pilleata TaxID=2714738 RepID=A0A5C6A904_9BACT|nr:hypothetical protein [Neorhodopirellula pilleata]TWT95785.1 hypothetical protein Pla100_34280 [Neorhodopirellula pilleata]
MSQPTDPNPNRAPWTQGNPSSEFATAGPRPYEPGASNAPGGPGGPPRKSGLGCWFWGCLGTLVVTLLAMIGIGFGTYWFLTSQVAKYTDTQPAEIPVVEMEEKELEELQARIEAFTSQVKGETTPTDETETGSTVADESTGDDQPTDSEVAAEQPGEQPAAEPGTQPAGETAAPVAAEPMKELVLTAEEINALIATEEQLRGRVFVRIEEGRVFGEVSFPTDMVPGGGGRFFNADAEFDVSMQDGILEVRLTDASVKGERIPETVLEGFSQENLAKDAYKDRKNAEILRKFESIEVVDDSIVLKLKEPE